MPAVSIIIPVYKVEAFIRRCLDSVRAQTYHDWEAICVDDGSPDACPDILEEYADKDSRFKIIHKQNGGLSSARNAAMPEVSGKYIVFLDSDDFLHPQTLEICVYLAERDNSDMVAYTYNRAYRSETFVRHLLHIPEKKNIIYRKYIPEDIVAVNTDNIFDWSSDYYYADLIPEKQWVVKHCHVWKCMYLASVVKDIKFIEGVIYEDFPWWSEIMLHVHKTTIINLPLYFYYPNEKSIIFSAGQKRKIESLKIVIATTEKLYAEQATEEQRKKWEKNFLLPFKNKLLEKEKLHGDEK